MKRYLGLPYKRQKELIKELHRAYIFDLVVIESNQYQSVLPQDLQDETTMPILPYNTGKEKHSFEIGIPKVRTHFENKRYIIPKDISLDPLFAELQGWITEKDGKVKSIMQHDDTTMALWLATIGAERIGSSILMARKKKR